MQFQINILPTFTSYLQLNRWGYTTAVGTTTGWCFTERLEVRWKLCDVTVSTQDSTHVGIGTGQPDALSFHRTSTF